MKTRLNQNGSLFIIKPALAFTSIPATSYLVTTAEIKKINVDKLKAQDKVLRTLQVHMPKFENEEWSFFNSFHQGIVNLLSVLEDDTITDSAKQDQWTNDLKGAIGICFEGFEGKYQSFFKNSTAIF